MICGQRIALDPVSRTLRLGAFPVDRLDADRGAMLPWPPVPLHLGWRDSVRLGRGYYVRLGSNDDSGGPSVIGRAVDAGPILKPVRVRADGHVVADYARRWARRSTLTDRAHVEITGRLRRQFRPLRRAVAGDDLAWGVADYGRAFELIDGQIS